MSKKRENNAFANILGVPAAPAAAVTVAPEPVPPRGRGRPRVRAEAPQTTTIRLSGDNHQKVRQLALRDRLPMNTLVLTALAEYCASRGVQLESELINS